MVVMDTMVVRGVAGTPSVTYETVNETTRKPERKKIMFRAVHEDIATVHAHRYTTNTRIAINICRKCLSTEESSEYLYGKASRIVLSETLNLCPEMVHEKHFAYSQTTGMKKWGGRLYNVDPSYSRLQS
ncbi:hypothetical protein E2C01_031276 [Portunus trituberculatus]|uniref:Uncharacterized protein n=1 Tax=Portunus trituberculatus TaxID=210409 RepID=A0A5B7EWF4_PORTR|nr:hypothetical protein [Portunus trituberculatus]